MPELSNCDLDDFISSNGVDPVPPPRPDRGPTREVPESREQPYPVAKEEARQLLPLTGQSGQGHRGMNMSGEDVFTGLLGGVVTEGEG